MTRPDLGFRRLFALWAPLALTFLLLTGGTPVINASVNRLPGADHEVELAAFSLLLGLAIFLQSPLFVTREIAIKLSIDRAGARTALKICLGAGALMAGVELLLGITPLGAMLLELFTDRQEIIARAHQALPVLCPMPLLIAVRGVYQAHQIRVDDTLFVGLGSLARLVATGIIGLLLGPWLGWPGATLGAFCMVIGAALEMAFALWRARAKARPPEHAPRGARRLHPLRFALPLMLANFLGVTSSIFYLKLAGAVPELEQNSSFAALQEVRSLQWLVVSGAMAVQSLTTAKVQTREDAKRMLGFAAFVSGCLTLLLAVVAFVPPIRDWILIDLLGEDPAGKGYPKAVAALAIAAAMPLLQGLRFAMRGILIARGLTTTITIATIATLILLSIVLASSWTFSDTNGAWNAYIWWTAAVALEIAILAAFVLRPRKQAELPASGVKMPREFTGG